MLPYLLVSVIIDDIERIVLVCGLVLAELRIFYCV